MSESPKSPGSPDTPGFPDSPTAPDVDLRLFSQPRLLAGARALISNIAQRMGFNEVLCGQISLAIDEALCNIINHGYDRRPDGIIRVNIWAIEHPIASLRIVIEDEARQVDPCCIQSRDLDDVRPGGLGVYLIHEIMDEVCYEKRSEKGMRLTMLKYLPTTQENNPGGQEASAAPYTSRTVKR